MHIFQKFGRPPTYREFSEPIAGPNEVRVAIKAAAMSQLVKSWASGGHYSSLGTLPFVAGIDGVGLLDDARRVYFVLPRAAFGSMAERTVVSAAQCLHLPPELDDLTVAAIANPGMSSWVAYAERANFKVGETVLVNGATGTAGKLAVQIAKHMGAAKVIATGRDQAALRDVAALGADVIIPLVADEGELEQRFKEQFAKRIDVVVDYLWGPSAERLLSAGAKTGPDAIPIPFVQTGSVSGADVTLTSSVLRSSPIELMGSGHGSISLGRHLRAVAALLQAVLPGSFKIAFKAAALSEGSQAWSADDCKNRTVFTI